MENGENQLYSDRVEDYLVCDEVIDFDNEAVAELADSLYRAAENETDFVRRAYEFVRGSILHSLETDDDTVTCSASQVLAAGHGICYARAHLLAALLRSHAVPAGFCYQKISLSGDPASLPVCHGLNGVYLREYGKWIRLDAGGTTDNAGAYFSVDEEHLAFALRPECGESDSRLIYAAPDANIIRALRSHSSRAALWAALPTELAYEQADK